ncbi:MAG TPA: DsbA family protein [Shinella sp.]|jgi:protein-disulfide isomerase|uniref:DsbA family protein n=1 Tax=Shinella TaxID=323620 RepID=UPI0007DA5883|nr:MULTISPECIES: DsbA family protein [Shinella]CAI0341793.1 Periplasmic thiol:disulfide interchange protein DsbA [Rhizobiaceae bacterium]CAK7262259.1 Disulfide bond formation protein DsbA [Shinella sp. WSC3-e]ANH09101.1 disulfide bond formation protein DsbA [Shinella sp. HZN7]MDC7260258.1 DsbA family protein [Shinella sp. YE25]HEV7251352.1 DsbA family protein [Shinella sp.]
MFRRQFLGSTAAAFTLLAANRVVAQTAATGSATDLLQPGPLPERILGRDDAPVTVIEYASMTCGHCANFHLNIWPAFKAEFIDTGKVRFILREFPFDPRATAAFMLARCTGDDRWYPTVDLLFRNQPRWARAQDGKEGFLSVLSMTGLKEADLEACLSDQALLDKVNAVAARGQELGVDSTPTFFINGEKYTGVMPIEQLRAVIEPIVAGAKK